MVLLLGGEGAEKTPRVRGGGQSWRLGLEEVAALGMRNSCSQSQGWRSSSALEWWVHWGGQGEESLKLGVGFQFQHRVVMGWEARLL